MLTVTLAYIANLNITELRILTISDNIGQSLLDDFGEGAISAYQRQVDFCDLFSPPGVKLFQTRSGTCHSTRPCRSSFPHWSIDPLLCEFLGSKDLRFRDSIHFSSLDGSRFPTKECRESQVTRTTWHPIPSSLSVRGCAIHLQRHLQTTGTFTSSSLTARDVERKIVNILIFHFEFRALNTSEALRYWFAA